MGRSRRRRLGQNFLRDDRVAARIVDLLASEPPRVAEIGPGRGALTRHLIDRFERVVAVETDDELAEYLGSSFDQDELQLVHEDALKVDFSALLSAHAPWQMAANLPYSVGTQIVRRLMPLHGIFSRLVLMLQREMVDRLVAQPGEREHGLLALERAAFANARAAFDVPPAAFKPRPRVDSSVVILEPFECPHPPELLKRALSLAAHALTRRRKVMANAVRPLVQVRELESAAIDPNVRPGTLALEDWLRLAEKLTS